MFLQSILVYISLILVMMIFGYIESIKAKSFITTNNTLKVNRSFLHIEIIIPILIFSIVMGMRYDVGFDQLHYIDFYLNNNYAGKGEYLFNLISDICWYFNFHYATYFGIIAFLQITFIYLAFKEERFLYPLLIFFLFMNGNIFFLMNVMRQGLALCIWLYSLKYLLHKKAILYFIMCFIAFNIHKSALILCVFYPILIKEKDYFKSIKLQLTLYISSFLVSQILLNLVNEFSGVIDFYISLIGDKEQYKGYDLENLTEVVESNGSGIAMYFKIILNFMIILYSNKMKLFYNNKGFIMIYFFFMIGLITQYIFPIGLISMTRPFRYFYIFQPIVYAYFIYYLFYNRTNGNNYILLLSIIFLMIMSFILSQFNSNEGSHLLYQFYFQYPFINGYPN